MRRHGRPHGSGIRPAPPRSRFYHGPFGRLFRNLAALEIRGEALKALAGRMYEPRKAGDDPAFDNPDIPAGYTYLGQFIDHDITFDPTSNLQRRNDPDRIQNFRTPRFDLDSLYGTGPADAPYLYHATRPGKLLVGRAGDKAATEFDLPRNEQGIALIGDPRNDENTIVSQLQLAFIRFHNAVVDRLVGGPEVFRKAQRLVQWHYQWIVVHDFLKRVVGAALVDQILEGTGIPGRPELRFYAYEEAPFIPVEFSAAAFRFGHSMVRRAYHLNDPLDAIRAKIDGGKIPLFVARPPRTRPELADLRGPKSLPTAWTIQWDRFLDISAGRPPQPSRRLDTKLAPALKTLPAPPGGDLAHRNLLRGVAFGLPSGQSVARAMALEPLPGEHPLWYYVLEEAEVHGQGRHLGPVGGRIVAEVLIGLLAGDPQSYLSVEPAWRPTLPSRLGQGEFSLADLLKIAGVPLTAGDLPFGPPGQ